MAAVAQVRDIDRGLKGLLDRLARSKTEITVGIHAQDGDVAKRGPEAKGTTLFQVAAAHEFGIGVPRRSFIADWQDENADKHAKQIAAMARAIVAGTVPSAEVAAERLANLWVAEVQKRIVAGISPPLSPITVKRKKSSTPLIDTGQLRSSIAYAINNKLHPSQAFEQATRERIKNAKSAERKAASEKAKASKKAARAAVPKRAKKSVNTAASKATKPRATSPKKARKRAKKKKTR